jgi:hypothetical protein
MDLPLSEVWMVAMILVARVDTKSSSTSMDDFCLPISMIIAGYCRYFASIITRGKSSKFGGGSDLAGLGQSR